MTEMKKLPLVLTVLGLGASATFAEIKLTDNLSTTGFLDMSIAGMSQDTNSALTATFDQFELDFMYKYGEKVSARADLSYGGVGGGSNSIPGSLGGVGALALEQGYATATLGSIAISGGRFLSMSGFEAAEPTGMFQYSYSENILGPAGAVYGGYQNGLNIAFTTPKFALYGAVVADLWSTAESDLKTPGIEAQVALTPVEGVTAKVAYLYQMYDEDATGDASQQLLNAWASYAKGAITVAAEVNMLMDWDAPGAGPNDESGTGYLVLANYKFSDTFAGTVRHSAMMYADLDPTMEFTVSPSLALAPNWLALAEFRYDMDPDPIEPTLSYAVESTFSF